MYNVMQAVNTKDFVFHKVIIREQQGWREDTL